MVDATQASVEAKSNPNKNPQPLTTYGQATMYASLPKSETSQNTSDSGRYVPPPKETIVQPESHPITIPYSESEMSQYASIHPPKEMPNLTDVNAVKGNEAVYNYVKNQPVKSEPSQVAESIVQSNKTFNDQGLVSIYAGRETKNGVTTETTITPEVSFEAPIITTESSKINYVRKNDNLLKLGLASVIEAPAFIGLSFGSLVADLTGKEILGVKPGTPETREQRVTTALQQRIGQTPLDELMSGNLEMKGYTLPEKAVGLISAGAGLYLTGGANIKEDFGNIVSRIVKSPQSATSKIATLISKSMQEEKLIMSKPEMTKTTFEIHQGVPESGVSQVKYSELTNVNPSVERLPTGEVKATKPQPPSYFKPTIQETGIGAKGEPVKLEKENIIQLNKEQEGEAKIPTVFGNLEEKSLTLVRGEGLSKLEPTKYLMEVQGGGKLSNLEQAGLAVHLGAENYKVSGNIFEFEATPLTKSLVRKNISPGEKKMPLVLQGTHLFKFGLKSSVKNTELPFAITKEPEIIKGSRLPEIERPNVIETLIMKHPSSVKYVPPKSFEAKTKVERQPTKERFDTERYPLMTSHEKISHAESILKSFTSKAETNKPFSSMMTGNKADTTLETLSYPKGTESKFLVSFKPANEILSTSFRGNKSQTIITESEQIQKSRQSEGVDLLNKNVQDVLTIKNQKEKSMNNLLTKSEFSTKQSQIPLGLQSTKSVQTTDLITKQTTEQITTTTHPNEIQQKNDRGFIPLIPEDKKLFKKLKKRSAKEVNFLGAAPVASVIGLTRRADITYGNKITAGLVKHDISKESHGKFESSTINKPKREESKPFNLYTKLSVNKRTSQRHNPTSTKKPKNEFYSKKSKRPKF